MAFQIDHKKFSSEKLKIKSRFDNFNSVDNLYVDLVSTNLSDDPDVRDEGIVFKLLRNTAIVEHPNDFYLSVISYTLNGFGLPIFQSKIETNQPDINKTVYKVRLEYLGFTAERNVNFIPQRYDLTPPLSPVGDTQTPTEYYFLYDFESTLFMFNTCIKDTLSDLNALITLPTTEAPFIVYSATNKLFSIVAEIASYDNGNPNPIKIYFNEELFHLFYGLPSNQYIINNKRYYQLLFLDQENNYYNPQDKIASSPPLFYKNNQSFSSALAWNPLKSLIFESYDLPIRSEIIPSIGNQSGSTGSSLRKILIDHELIYDDISYDYRSVYSYNSNGDNRLIDLQGSSPLTQITVIVYWVDIFGTRYTFPLSTYQSSSLRLVFRRKNLHKNFISLADI